MRILGMVLAQDFLLDLQCLAIERFGLLKVALVHIQPSQIGQADGIIRVALAQDLSSDLQSLAEKRFGPRIVALALHTSRPNCSGCRA